MNAMLTENRPRLTLQAETAAELMSENPVSISDQATMGEAMEFLTDKGFSAAPVIDAAGRPVGVLSRTDLLIHQRERIRHPMLPKRQFNPEGYEVEKADSTLVRDVMTPGVFSVEPNTPVTAVVEHLLGLKVHRLFVVDEAGVLTGVISTVDVLQHLKV
jgi:CBS-domain-containing membrane protein